MFHNNYNNKICKSINLQTRTVFKNLLSTASIQSTFLPRNSVRMLADGSFHVPQVPSYLKNHETNKNNAESDILPAGYIFSSA